jgi:hypothetical protein
MGRRFRVTITQAVLLVIFWKKVDLITAAEAPPVDGFTVQQYLRSRTFYYGSYSYKYLSKAF